MLFMSLVKVMDLLGKIIPRLLQDPTYNFGFVSMWIFRRSLAMLPFIMVTTAIPQGPKTSFSLDDCYRYRNLTNHPYLDGIMFNHKT